MGDKTLEAASCDWTIYLEQIPDAKRLLPLRLRAVYNTALYSRERMAELLRQLEIVAHLMAARPEATLNQAGDAALRAPA